MKRSESKTSYPLLSSNTTKMRGPGPAAAKVLFASSSPAAAGGLQPDSCWVAEKVMWVACGPAGSCRAMDPTARSLTYLQADSTLLCQETIRHALMLQVCVWAVLKGIVRHTTCTGQLAQLTGLQLWFTFFVTHVLATICAVICAEVTGNTEARQHTSCYKIRSRHQKYP